MTLKNNYKQPILANKGVEKIQTEKKPKPPEFQINRNKNFATLWNWSKRRDSKPRPLHPHEGSALPSYDDGT